MHYFPVKSTKLSGAGSDKEILKRASDYFRALMCRTKRQPYIRSAYFGKQKIFFTYFWKHLYQKPPRQRKEKVLFLPCAIELVQKSRNTPTSKPNPNKKSELLYRFYGVTRNKEKFYVQVKENVNTKRKEFMSIVIPRKQKTPRGLVYKLTHKGI